MPETRIPGRVVERLASARSVAALSGAGVSAESGIETFRDEDGLWTKVNIEEVATPQGFARDPVRVWRWYDERRAKLKARKPNPAHRALAEMERMVSRFTMITQNIDNLHKEAGSRNIIELHGNIWKVIDTVTGEEEYNLEAPLREVPPMSRRGNMLRPGVVWFGEPLPEGAMERAAAASEESEVFLVVGTSAVVQPAASLPLFARRAGAMVLEFTLQETELTPLVDFTFFGRAGETLPGLLDLIRSYQ